MREILFRGKRLDNGEWVEGAFLNDRDGAFYICPSVSDISYGDGGNRRRIGCWYKVDPSTVGQYTGTNDNHGKKIFEGDIVRVLGNQQVEDWKNVDYVALIAFLDGGFCAIDGTVEEHGFRRYALARMDFSLEVIGNIYDNPELLDGGAE